MRGLRLIGEARWRELAGHGMVQHVAHCQPASAVAGAFAHSPHAFTENFFTGFRFADIGWAHLFVASLGLAQWG